MKSQSIIVCEWTSQDVSLARWAQDASRSGAIEPIWQQSFIHDQREVAEELQSQIRKYIKQARSLCLVLPRSLFIFKNLVLPSQDTEELKSLLQHQIALHVPYSRDEIYWDYLVVDTLDSGYSRVLLMVAPGDKLKPYLSLLTPFNQYLQYVTIGAWSLQGYRRICAHESQGGVYAMLLIKEFDSHICISRREYFYSSRWIYAGGHQVRTGQIADLVEQISLTLRNYHQEKIGPPVEKIVVIDSSGEQKSFLQELKMQLSLPVEAVAPLEALKEYEMLKADELNNFLPDIVQNMQLRNQRIWQIARVLCLAGLALLAIAMANYAPLIRKARAVSLLQSQVQALAPRLREVDSQKSLRELYLTQVSGEVSVLEILRELTRIMPSEIMVQSFHLEPSGQLTLQGLSLSDSQVNSLQSRMLSNAIFKNVKLEHAMRRVTQQGERTQFVILAMVNTDGGAR